MVIASRYFYLKQVLSCFTVEGLEKAQITTAAMYDSSIENLSKLSARDIETLFTGAKVIDLLLTPGLTVKELALTAGCFNHPGE